MSDDLYRRARALKLHGLCQYWQEVTQSPWVSTLLGWNAGKNQKSKPNP